MWMLAGCAGSPADVSLGGLSPAASAPLEAHEWAELKPPAPHPEDVAALQELEYKISVRCPQALRCGSPSPPRARSPTGVAVQQG